MCVYEQTYTTCKAIPVYTSSHVIDVPSDSPTSSTGTSSAWVAMVICSMKINNHKITYIKTDCENIIVVWNINAGKLRLIN